MRTWTAPQRSCNADVAWDGFDTRSYVADNYASLHEVDRRIITTLAPFYRSLPSGSVRTALDVGTGPNLYPLMLAGAASRQIHVIEHSAANVEHLRAVCAQGADPGWLPFWQLCRDLLPELPADLAQVLSRVRVSQGSAFALPARRYDLASMFFVAESVTGERDEFELLTQRFVRAAVPGGRLVAAFMAGMPQYELAGEVLPSFPLDEAGLEHVVGPLTTDLTIERLPADPTIPYEHDGVLLMTARAPD